MSGPAQGADAHRRARGGQGGRGSGEARQRGGAVAGPAYIAVCGPGEASAAELQAAEAVGRGLAGAGAFLVCGGRCGVMEAACRGAALAGGATIGILPGSDRAEANRYVRVAIATGLGELRNGLIVRAADAVIAVGGAYGTLSEVALALKTSVPVVGLGTWSIDGVEAVESAEDAVRRALELIGSEGGPMLP